MIRKYDSRLMGRSHLDWLESYYHFSFADYYNQNRLRFGMLRVINDDEIRPKTGFDVHPHENMEIITYVVKGELTHGDSLENKSTLKRGEVQYMSAGTGISHSEMNQGDEPLRLLQIWIFPDKNGYTPRYGEFKLPWEDREDRWLLLVSGGEGEGPVKIHQDMNIYVSALKAGGALKYDVGDRRQAYLVLVEGEAEINGTGVRARDGVEITEPFVLTARPDCHAILFEMRRTMR